MMRLRWTRPALAHVREIGEHIRQGNLRAAHRVVLTIRERVPARTAMWARMNAFHVVVRLRSGAGGMPLRRRMFPTVSSDRE